MLMVCVQAWHLMLSVDKSTSVGIQLEVSPCLLSDHRSRQVCL